MARARIQVNGSFTSSVSVPIGVPALLSNDDEGGETTYAWTIVDQPEGAADALTNSTIENPQFTPKKEGSYLLRLVVNLGTGTEATDLCVVSVLDARTNERVPAAAETVEDSTTRGWAQSLNRILSRTLQAAIEGSIVAAVTPGSLAAGSIVKLQGMSTINPTMTFPHELPGIVAALATTLSNVQGKLGVILDGVVPGQLGAGKAVLVRVEGIAPLTVVESGAVVGQAVYVSDAGLPTLTPGTRTRQIGSVIAADATTFRWMVLGGSSPQDAGDKILNINSLDGKWETPTDMILQPGYVESNGFAVYNLAIPLNEGDRLKTITFRRFGNGVADISAGSVSRFDLDGSSNSIAGSITVTNPAASWADTVANVASPAALPAGSSIWLQLTLNAAGIKLGTFRCAYDHPV